MAWIAFPSNGEMRVLSGCCQISRRQEQDTSTDSASQRRFRARCINGDENSSCGGGGGGDDGDTARSAQMANTSCRINSDKLKGTLSITNHRGKTHNKIKS